jgi:hypothetical protein
VLLREPHPREAHNTYSQNTHKSHLTKSRKHGIHLCQLLDLCKTACVRNPHKWWHTEGPKLDDWCPTRNINHGGLAAHSNRDCIEELSKGRVVKWWQGPSHAQWVDLVDDAPHGLQKVPAAAPMILLPLACHDLWARRWDPHPLEHLLTILQQLCHHGRICAFVAIVTQSSPFTPVP